jgi:hypothetical protein
MLTLYFAEILDYSNKPVMKLQYTASAKHSAMLATQFVRDVPPACSFTIRKAVFKASDIAYLLNKRD